jgi:hypothetical protein
MGAAGIIICCAGGCVCEYTGDAVHLTCEGGCYVLSRGILTLTASGSGTTEGSGGGDHISISYEWSVTASIDLTAIGFFVGWNDFWSFTRGLPSPISVTGSATGTATMIDNIAGPGVVATVAAPVSLGAQMFVDEAGFRIEAGVARGYSEPSLGLGEYIGFTVNGGFQLTFPLDVIATRAAIANGDTITFSSSDEDAVVNVGGGGTPDGDWSVIFDSDDSATGSGSGTYQGVTTPLSPFVNEALPRALAINGTYDGDAFTGRVALTARAECDGVGFGSGIYTGTGTLNGSPVTMNLTLQVYATNYYVWVLNVGTSISLGWKQSTPSPSPSGIKEVTVLLGYIDPPSGTSLSITETACVAADPVQFCRPCVLCDDCPEGPVDVVTTFSFDDGGGLDNWDVDGTRESTSPCNYSFSNGDFHGDAQPETPGTDSYGNVHGHRMRLRIYRVDTDEQIFDGVKICRNDGTPEITGTYASLPPTGMGGGPLYADIT